jgi:hypothetical protein
MPDSTPLSTREVTAEAGINAVYEAQNPQAVYYEDTKTTFIAYNGPKNDPYITAYDHESEMLAEHVLVGLSPLPNHDDHGPPTLTVDGDGYLHVFYGCHGGPIQYARSERPLDITTWKQRSLTSIPGGTYPSPVAFEGRLYVLYRTGDGHGNTYPCHEYATIAVSENGGETWADTGPIIDLTGHPDRCADAYVMDFDAQDTLRLTWTVAHGEKHDELRSNVYYAEYDPESGTIRSPSGEKLGTRLDWEDHETTKVYEGDSIGVLKHAFDAERTYILFNALREGHRQWLLASSEGDGWNVESVDDARTSHICNAGSLRATEDRLEAHVICDDHDANRDDTRQVSNRGGVYRIYTRDGDGWGVDSPTFSGKPIEGHRLTVPRDAHEQLRSLVVEHPREQTINSDDVAREDESLFDTVYQSTKFLPGVETVYDMLGQIGIVRRAFWKVKYGLPLVSYELHRDEYTLISVGEH